MKRITAYRKLFNTDKDADLKQLKSAYRNLVKEWHPDKFQDGDVRKEEAQLKSREIIDAYHFLVSIAPETHAANKEVYTETITNSGIADYQHKGLVLEITFTDGSTYEYFGIAKPLFLKFHNAGNQVRFAKRNIYNTVLYRKSKRLLQEA